MNLNKARQKPEELGEQARREDGWAVWLGGPEPGLSRP